MNISFIRICLALLLICSISAKAQEYEIKSLKLAEDDQSAVTNKRLDINNQPCALIKVLVADSIIKVDGNVVGNVERKGSYLWIYITDGTKRIDLHFKKHLSLSVSFPDYDIQYVKSLKTYTLSLSETKMTQQMTNKVVRDTIAAHEKYTEGLRCFNGKGVNKDYKKAATLFQEGADLGSARAMCYLGYCYEKG